VLVAAWFALGIRQAHDIARATSIVSSSARLTPAQAAHANALLNSAGTLNPDQEVDILRARVQGALGDNAAADRILAGVTRREPEDLEAWAYVGRLAQDKAVLDHALIRIAQLDPIDTVTQ
jgi:predicted Zn-dependent protease